MEEFFLTTLYVIGTTVYLNLSWNTTLEQVHSDSEGMQRIIISSIEQLKGSVKLDLQYFPCFSGSIIFWITKPSRRNKVLLCNSGYKSLCCSMHPQEPSQFNLTVIAKICSLGVPCAAVSIGLLGPISSIATLQIKVWRVAKPLAAVSNSPMFDMWPRLPGFTILKRPLRNNLWTALPREYC